MASIIASLAIKYLESQLKDIIKFWEIAIPMVSLSIINADLLGKIALASIIFILRKGTPSENTVREMLKKRKIIT